MFETEDGAAFIQFLLNSSKVRFSMDLKKGEGWQEGSARFQKWAKKFLVDDSYRIHLDREDDLTRDTAYYVVHCKEEDVPAIRRRWLGESY